MKRVSIKNGIQHSGAGYFSEGVHEVDETVAEELLKNEACTIAGGSAADKKGMDKKIKAAEKELEKALEARNELMEEIKKIEPSSEPEINDAEAAIQKAEEKAQEILENGKKLEAELKELQADKAKSGSGNKNRGEMQKVSQSLKENNKDYEAAQKKKKECVEAYKKLVGPTEKYEKELEEAEAAVEKAAEKLEQAKKGE